MTPRADRRRDVKCTLLKNWVLHERQVLSKLLEPLTFIAECSRDSNKLFNIINIFNIKFIKYSKKRSYYSTSYL